MTATRRRLLAISCLCLLALASMPFAARAADFVIDSEPLPEGFVGTDYAGFVSATGGSGTPYKWSLANGSLPKGLKLTDFASSTGLISGRPTRVQTSTFTVRARDRSGNTTTQQFTIVVNPARPLVVTSPPELSPGTVGEPYAIGVFADGGTTPYSWTLVGGSLPPGLSLQKSPGRVQGTPTAAGTFGFTLRVDDSGGQSTTATFTITVSDPEPPPTPPGAPGLVSPADGASVITPFTLEWSAPEGTTPISAYNWMVSSDADFSTVAAIGSTPGDVTRATVSELANGTYFWRVEAVNGTAVGLPSVSRSFTVTGTTNPPALAGVSVTPEHVTGGDTAAGTVSITQPAPESGVQVLLTSSEPAVAQVPASVTITAGQTSAGFAVPTSPVTSSHTVVITASFGGQSRFAFLGVAP
jgi:hypothetical protein